jgi:dipeptidyl aminopeptidase/acylaminoacyl peptidase
MKQTLVLMGVFFAFVAQAQKKELDHSVYDNWQSIKEVVVHPYGTYFAYSITPQEGDAILVIQQKVTHQEISIPRGTQPVFTENGEYVIAKIKPSYAETRQAKIDKKKADDMPKDSLVIVQLSNNTIQKIPAVKSFQVPEHGNNVVAFLKDPKGDINKEGADLMLLDLTNGKQRTFNNISQYSIHPKGLSIVMYQIKTKQKEASVYLANTTDTLIKKLNSHFYTATNFKWDELGNQLAYLIEKDSTNKALQKNYSVAYFNVSMDSASIAVTTNTTNMPAHYVIGADHALSFSKNGNSIEFGIQPIIPFKDTSLPEFERVSVDIWHYADPTIQPMQLKNLDANLKSTETVLYTPASKQLVYLGKINEKAILKTAEGDGKYSYAIIDSTDMIASQWQGYAMRDLYIINNQTGVKKLIQANVKASQISPAYDGNTLLFYNEPKKKYVSYNALTGVKKEVFLDIPNPLYDEENDVPDDANAYGIAKWLDNHHQVLVYDKYDIWLADVNGAKPSVKLTNGRKEKMVYRFVETDPEHKTIQTNSTVLLKTFNDIDKSEGLATLDLNRKKLFTINQIPMHITSVNAAKNSKDLIVMQEDEKQSPNLYVYQMDSIRQNPAAVSQINAQQANYNWMTSQLVQWKSYTGKKAEGILYLPENFDATKKYPMIVYFYERNNQTLHNYLAPAPTPSRLNISFFASRGYIVFVPDIWYKKGYPGQSAYDYIVSGTRAMIQKGFIDSTKLGLQGQSWGGYQIAYLITQTKLFAAAWAGAPVVNMTSAYGGIRWGTGMNRQFQYEKTQSRIGATLWERPDLYIKNSPLFSLPNVTTPLVIMSNDADDAVPWYQGIEMYTAMRRLNKKVWLLVYNNEAHNLVERRNRKDIQIREQQFFDSYLKGAPMPTWLSTGVPAIMKGRTMGL